MGESKRLPSDPEIREKLVEMGFELTEEGDIIMDYGLLELWKDYLAWYNKHHGTKFGTEDLY